MDPEGLLFNGPVIHGDLKYSKVMINKFGKEHHIEGLCNKNKIILF